MTKTRKRAQGEGEVEILRGKRVETRGGPKLEEKRGGSKLEEGRN